MVKSRLIQIVYRSVEAVFGLLCVLVAIGVISNTQTAGSQSQFYLFFTNLSNFAVIIYVYAELVFTIVRFIKGDKENNSSLCLPVKYSLMIGVLLTMLVANTMLGSMMGFIWQGKWWQNLINPFLHFFMPLLFIVDFLFFSEVGKMKKTYPFYSLIFPLLYLVFIFIRAAVLPSSYEGVIYPYPFINVATNGWGITLAYILGLVAIFVLIGFGFYFIDRKRGKKAK